MALTLPYPSMVFVPLDILTAEEMNELVSNIEYISNQFPLASAALASNSITTDKIANGAVTSDKIDFATQKPNGDIVIQLNGVQIVSMRRSFDVNISNPWGSWYDAVVGYFDYPEPFDDLPVVTVTAVAFDFGVLVEYVGDSGGSQPIATNSHTGQIGLARATAANDVTGYLCITAIGPKG